MADLKRQPLEAELRAVGRSFASLNHQAMVGSVDELVQACLDKQHKDKDKDRSEKKKEEERKENDLEPNEMAARIQQSGAALDAVMIASAFLTFTRVVDMTGHKSALVHRGAMVLSSVAYFRNHMPQLALLLAGGVAAVAWLLRR